MMKNALIAILFMLCWLGAYMLGRSHSEVKIVKEPPTIATYLFSLTNGWLEIQREPVSGAVTFFPMMLPKADEAVEAAKREASIEEYRKYNGLRYLKNLAILLGESPESLDSIGLE